MPMGWLGLLSEPLFCLAFDHLINVALLSKAPLCFEMKAVSDHQLIGG